jgi:hypothetical protein
MRLPDACKSKEGSKAAFLEGLQWTHTGNAERIKAFPSWSWTGWKGSSVDGIFGAIGRNAKNTEVVDIKLSIELSDSTQVEWPTAENLAQITNLNLSRFLIIQGWALRLHFKWTEKATFWIEEHELPCFCVKSRWSIYPKKVRLHKAAPAGGELHERLLKDTFFGIVIDIEKKGRACTVLVVEPCEDYFERLGIVRIEFLERVFDAKTGRVFSEEEEEGFRNATLRQPPDMLAAEMMTLRLG